VVAFAPADGRIGFAALDQSGLTATHPPRTCRVTRVIRFTPGLQAGAGTPEAQAEGTTGESVPEPDGEQT